MLHNNIGSKKVLRGCVLVIVIFAIASLSLVALSLEPSIANILAVLGIFAAIAIALIMSTK